MEQEAYKGRKRGFYRPITATKFAPFFFDSDLHCRLTYDENKEGTCNTAVKTPDRNAPRANGKAGRLTLPVPVWKPKFDNRKDRWLNRSEVAALLKAARKNPRARGYLPLFILLGIYTAARHSAILSLKWSQVDLEAGLLDLHTKGEERTNKGKALIPIPKRLMTFLRHAKRKGSPNGYVVHENQRGFQSVKKTFGEACKLAGLDGVSPHTLRHTSASWMAQRRVPFPLIARFLGHTDSRITERIYSHHNPDYLNAAAEALDNRPMTATTRLEHDMTKPKLRLVTGG